MCENTKAVEVVGGIIRRGERYLLGKRPQGKSQGGHWEFIGGKIEPGETPEQALARECREEIALVIVNEKIRTSVTHTYPEKTIHLTLIDCEPAPGAEPRALEHSELCWFTPAEMQSLDFCPADAELLPMLFTKEESKKKSATKTIDMAEECRRDWVCAQRFNKIIWSKWPDSIFGLYEMLEKNGYVVRWNSPSEGFTMTVKKDLLDLYIAEKETADRMFMPYPSASSKKKGERMIADYRMAQRSRLVYTTYLCESDGGGVAFALFRDPGTENCLVYVMHQPRPVDEAELMESLGVKS